MSRASAQVKFPDGTIKYGVYNGTVDIYWAPLFNSSEEAWGAWREYYGSDADSSKWTNPFDDTYYDVEITDDYGGGDTYLGRASKSQIVSSLNVDHMNNIKSGRADWWVSNATPNTQSQGGKDE